ncbi:MAG: hybrid sensor histidine kinase/response regulator [Campylobacterota bacterium]|nr:hybrid sensor histidine kinase/response regulator [Campylobacterota bacterium]
MFKAFNLLYVEDEINILNSIGDSLGFLFNNIYKKTNGQDGLEFYINNKDKIDIIITDIHMPKKNGLKMSQEIKNIDPLIPIIITSAYGDVNFLNDAINIGINGYIIKPFDVMNLIEVLKRALESKILKNRLIEQEKDNQDKLLKSAKFTAIGQVTAGLTHEINTPLTYIKGSVEIIDKKIKNLNDLPLKKALEKQHNIIKDGIIRINNIIDSMFEMTQYNSEEFEYVNIYNTIIVSTVMAYNRSKHISNIYINGELFSMNIDKSKYKFISYIQKQRVEQVWIVIINNALDELIKIKDFDNRRLDIIISEDDNNVKVIFKDNAGGIKNDIFKTLFEPFKSTKESSGMGVGLSIAKKIIDEQDATIDARNEDSCAIFEINFKKETK